MLQPITLISMLLALSIVIVAEKKNDEDTSLVWTETDSTVELPAITKASTRCTGPMAIPVPYSVNYEFALKASTMDPHHKESLVPVSSLKIRPCGCSPKPCAFLSDDGSGGKNGYLKLPWGQPVVDTDYEACIEKSKAAVALRIELLRRTKKK